MLAVCILFLSSILFVFVATLYLEGHSLAKCPDFFHNYNIVFDGHSLLPFSRGERSLEVIAHGSNLPPVYKQFRCFPLYFLK